VIVVIVSLVLVTRMNFRRCRIRRSELSQTTRNLIKFRSHLFIFRTKTKLSLL